MTGKNITIVLPVGKTTLSQAERLMIEATLEETRDNKPKTARLLGISLKTLYNKLNAYKAKPTAPAADYQI